MLAKYKQILFSLSFLFLVTSCSGGDKGSTSPPDTKLKLGIAQPDRYLPLLKGKKVGIVANQTSVNGDVHLVDFLLSKGVNVIKVFAPEHGFRGEAGPGDKVSSGKDSKTGLPMISLYGSRRKPTTDDLKDIEYLIFDIQDVGARFYTYISTLHYLMEACAENAIPLLVFDRPNPNGFYIDGPVLDTAYRSFVGIDPLPAVHGLTVGEYALMANGEGWLSGGVKCDVTIISMLGYDHGLQYKLPVKPSPNLPNMKSIYLYPSLCFFEGTMVSVGRGTDLPFQVYGYPGYSEGKYQFTPVEIEGIIKDPPYEGKLCNGIRFDKEWESIITNKQLNLDWLVNAYQSYPDKEKFFNNFFDKLAGTDKLRKQILANETVSSIRNSWQPELQKYKQMREKYLLYPDK